MVSLESIFSNIDEGLIIFTPSGETVYFNDEAHHMLQKVGITIQESINIFEIFPSISSERIKRIISDVMSKRESVRSGSDRIGSDGTPLYLEEIFVPTFDDDTITHINLLMRDNTEAKIFEKKITGMATELKNLIEQANAVIIGTDTRGYITEWNNHTSTLTNYTKHEALTQKFETLLMNEKDRPRFEEWVQRTLTGESLINIEVPIINKDGNPLIFLLSTTARLNLQNEITGVIFMGQDISLRLKIEKEFKFAHERLMFHLENSPLGFIEWDSQLKPKSWTQRVEEIFGWTYAEFLDRNQTGHSLVYEEDVPSVFKSADDLLQGRLDRNHLQHRNIRKDGKVIWCEWFNSVLKNDRGEVMTVMSLVQDITARKNNELNLQEALLELEAYKETLELKVQERTEDLMRALKKEKDVVEMKTRFVSIASHEFRTPLSSIQYAANYIRKNKHWSGDKELKEKLKDIEKQTKHMMYLLDDVLTYGKSEAGKIQLKISKIELQSFLNKIVEDVGHATKGSHTIQLRLMDAGLNVNTDEKLLRNILINLLTNAVKYSPGKDKVSFRVESTKYLVRFIIADEGIGIPEEELEKVFEPFVRGRSTENIQGTGLGLSIVKKSVELMKGNIKLDSQISRGTTITVTIPKSILP